MLGDALLKCLPAFTVCTEIGTFLSASSCSHMRILLFSLTYYFVISVFWGFTVALWEICVVQLYFRINRKKYVFFYVYANYVYVLNEKSTFLITTMQKCVFSVFSNLTLMYMESVSNLRIMIYVESVNNLILMIYMESDSRCILMIYMEGVNSCILMIYVESVINLSLYRWKVNVIDTAFILCLYVRYLWFSLQSITPLQLCKSFV